MFEIKNIETNFISRNEEVCFGQLRVNKVYRNLGSDIAGVKTGSLPVHMINDHDNAL